MTEERRDTPGPWFVSPLYGDANGITTCCSVGAYPVGPGTDSPRRDSHCEDTICEVWNGEHDGLANADLIASAPDMANVLLQWLQANHKSRSRFAKQVREVLHAAGIW